MDACVVAEEVHRLIEVGAEQQGLARSVVDADRQAQAVLAEGHAHFSRIPAKHGAKVAKREDARCAIDEIVGRAQQVDLEYALRKAQADKEHRIALVGSLGDVRDPVTGLSGRSSGICDGLGHSLVAKGVHDRHGHDQVGVGT